MSRTWMRSRDLLPLQSLLQRPSRAPSSARRGRSAGWDEDRTGVLSTAGPGADRAQPHSPAWDRLDDGWLQVGQAKGILAAEKQGRAAVRHERIAARELATLGDAVSAREVVVCTLAMFVMWEMEPRKFRSDDAFRMRLARRVRRLTEANAAHYFDHIAGKSKRVCRDPRRGAAKVFGGWLARR
jgi:hypothetical protein